MRSGLFNCLKNLSYKNAKEIGFKISKKKWYAQALSNFIFKQFKPLFK